MEKDKIIFICMVATLGIAAYIALAIVFESLNPTKWLGYSALMLVIYELFITIISILVLKNKL